MAEVFRAAGEVGAKLAADALWQSRTISAYTDAGHPVELITDIQQLVLRDVDKVKPSIGIRYMAAGAATGAVAGPRLLTEPFAGYGGQAGEE